MFGTYPNYSPNLYGESIQGTQIMSKIAYTNITESTPKIWTQNSTYYWDWYACILLYQVRAHTLAQARKRESAKNNN